MGVAAILVKGPIPFYKLPFPLPRGSLHENLALVDQAVSEEKISKIVDRRRRRRDNDH